MLYHYNTSLLNTHDLQLFMNYAESEP